MGFRPHNQIMGARDIQESQISENRVTQSLVIAGKINFIENKDKVKILNKV